MKIGFVSDTHGDDENFEKAVKFMHGYDMIIHAGDVLSYGSTAPSYLTEYIRTLSDIYFVRGNGDYFDGMKLMGKPVNDFERIFEIGDLRILATHGFVHSMRYYEEMAIDNKCKILVSGHTHVKKMEKYKDLVILNPGSLGRPRDGIASFAYLEDNILRLYDVRNYEVLQEMDIYK